MRQFVFQTIANLVSLVIVFLVMPGLAFVDAQPLVTFFNRFGLLEREQRFITHFILAAVFFFFLSALFTVIDRYVKPFIAALTGRLIVTSMGLSVLVINVLIFWLFLFISPVNWQITSPQWLRIILGGLILTAVKMVIDVVSGVNQRRALQEDPDKAFWERVERTSFIRNSGIVESLRVAQIYNKLFAYATDLAVERSAFRGFRARTYRWMFGEEPLAEYLSLPEKTRILLESLGPTWVKFGQMVASQAEALPLEWNEQLTRLQSSAEPFPYEDVEKTFLAEMKAKPDEVFATFAKEPFAAASTAQVHKATLADGTVVAVKVQRPDIVTKTKADLNIIQDVARVVQRRSKLADDLNISGMTGEFAKGVLNELDYRNESYHGRRLADNMADMPGIHVPNIYMDLSTRRIITQEFVKGVKLTNTAAIDAAGLNRNEIANSFLRAVIKQVLIDGFFHGDPHPGNLFVNPETGVITFLDLGLIGILTQKQRMNLLDLLYTMTQSDPVELANVAKNISRKTRPLDEAAFRQDMTDVFYKYWVYARSGVSFNEGMTAITEILSEHGLRLDPSLTLAVKSMVQADQSLLALDPNINLAVDAVTQARTLLADELTSDRIAEMVQTQITRTGRELVRRLPELQDATISWITQYQKGKFVVTIDTTDLTKGVDRFSRSVDRLTLGIILVGMLIGSAIALASLRAWMSEGDERLLPYVVGLLFIFVLISSLVVAWRMAGSMKTPKIDYEDM